MNEQLQRWIEKARVWVAGLSPRGRGLLFAGLALAVIGVTAATIIAKQDPYQTLYTDLQPEEMRSVAKKLSEQGIPYQNPDPSTIQVQGSQVANARMQLAKEGLPGQDVVGFEKFDGTTLGMSSYVQRIQYVRAMQGELTRSIQKLASVKNARVHISMPPKKTFLEEEDPPKASVVLELRNGQTPSKAEVNGIAHLVASAVEGLKVSEVTIVDTRGNFLHRPEDDGQPGMSSQLLEMQRSIESEYEKRVEEILSPVVGLGKVRAKVTAEIDPSRVNTTEESYDPEHATVRNNIRNEEVSQGSRPNPIGIPGSRSNLPGAETQNPPMPMANTSTEKNVSNTSYAIPRKVSVIDKPGGNIKRLTVAVVVDGYYTKGANGAETFNPRTEDELRRLQELVGNAVGFDQQRRDSINISSLPFHNAELPPEEINQGPWWKSPEVIHQFGQNGLLMLLAGIALFVFYRFVLRGPSSAAEQAPDLTIPRTVAELEAAREESGANALNKGAAGLIDDGEPLEKQEEAELRKRILDKLTAAPKKGFRIVQDWLDEDNVTTALPLPAEA